MEILSEYYHFSKYTKMKEKEAFENIEIKLQIDDDTDGELQEVLNSKM